MLVGNHPSFENCYLLTYPARRPVLVGSVTDTFLIFLVQLYSLASAAIPPLRQGLPSLAFRRRRPPAPLYLWSGLIPFS
jgi:hypothetical protein